MENIHIPNLWSLINTKLVTGANYLAKHRFCRWGQQVSLGRHRSGRKAVMACCTDHKLQVPADVGKEISWKQFGELALIATSDTFGLLHLLVRSFKAHTECTYFNKYMLILWSFRNTCWFQSLHITIGAV